MEPILAITVPFFALVLAGYVAAARHWLPDTAIPGLNGFVLFFALPCLLVRFGATLPVAQLIDVAVIGVWLLAGLGIVALTMVMTRRRMSQKDAAFGALVAAFPNTGFMGVPLLVALLGPAAAGPVMPTLLVDLFVTSSLCIAIAQSRPDAGAPTETGTRRALARALRGAAGNPLPWAILTGGLVSAAGLRLPGPLDTVVKMLADAASPVALFTIGAVVWRAGQHANTRTPIAAFVPVALVKLLVHPLLVFALAAAARSLGLLNGFQVTVLTLAAALPSASSVSLLAERYRADNGRIARIIVTATALAFVTFSLFAWLLDVRAA